jgi:anaerobic selenocysteine-containing dehydrogenase
MADEIEAGNLRALVVFGGNPASAFPNTERTLAALAQLEALIVLDVLPTDTTALATHVLPTKGQLDRADLPYYYDQFNLDFSTQFTPAMVPPPGDAQSMWWIAARMADELGAPILPAPLSTDSTDIEVLAAIASRAAAPFDEIQRAGYLASAPVFGWVLDRVLANHRWRLVPPELVHQLAAWQQLVPSPGLVATSRRQLRQLNSQHPTAHRHPTEGPTVLLHPDTASRHGVADGDTIAVSSTHGNVEMTAAYSTDVHPDTVSMPHGWPQANVSHLTTEQHIDHLTGMVAQTAIPVTVQRADNC